jgi:hypothetical protein
LLRLLPEPIALVFRTAPYRPAGRGQNPRKIEA